MPFPLAPLPYGYICRLRELSNPLEAYNLQIATGHRHDGLFPLQTVVSKYILCFDTDLDSNETTIGYDDNDENEDSDENDENDDDEIEDNNNLLERYGLEGDKATVLFNISESLCFVNPTDDIFTDGKLKRLYVNQLSALEIEQRERELTLPFLKTLACRFPSAKKLQLIAPECSLLFSEIIPVFPKIKDFYFTYTYKNWIQDLLAKQVTDVTLTLLYEEPDLRDTFYDFTGDSLAKFVKNKNKLEIYDQELERIEDVQRLISTKIAPQFRETPEKDKADFIFHMDEEELYFELIPNLTV